MPVEVLSAKPGQSFMSYYKLDIDIHKCVSIRAVLTPRLMERSHSTQHCRWSVTMSRHALQEPAECARGQEARQQRQLARRAAHARHCRPLAGLACSGCSMSVSHDPLCGFANIRACIASANALHVSLSMDQGARSSTSHTLRLAVCIAVLPREDTEVPAPGCGDHTVSALHLQVHQRWR